MQTTKIVSYIEWIGKRHIRVARETWVYSQHKDVPAWRKQTELVCIMLDGIVWC